MAPLPRGLARAEAPGKSTAMIDLLLAAALLQTADPCHAVPQGETARACPAWRSTGRTDRFEVFVNPASLARRGNTFEISLRIVYAAANPGGMRSGVSRQRFDCAARTNTMLHLTTYDAAGAVQIDRDAHAREAAPATAPPGSPNEALLTEFCPR